MHQSILDHLSHYITLTAEEEKYFLSLLKSRRLRKKDVLLQAGDVCRYETFVLSGCLRAFFVDPAGTEHIAQFAVADWWISDMASLITGEPATLYIDALVDSEIVLIERDKLEELYARIPKFEKFFRILLQKAYVAQQRRIIDNLCKPARERYQEFVMRYPSIEQLVPQYQVASYLGITPEFLSQLRRQIGNS
jgi:CRP-like cAMP-binding protein